MADPPVTKTTTAAKGGGRGRGRGRGHGGRGGPGQGSGRASTNTSGTPKAGNGTTSGNSSKDGDVPTTGRKMADLSIHPSSEGVGVRDSDSSSNNNNNTNRNTKSNTNNRTHPRPRQAKTENHNNGSQINTDRGHAKKTTHANSSKAKSEGDTKPDLQSGVEEKPKPTNKKENKEKPKPKPQQKKGSRDTTFVASSTSIPPSQAQQTSDIHYGRGNKITIFHVAEKPSIAQAVANGLSHGHSTHLRKGTLPVHEFTGGTFPKAPYASSVSHKISSVAGHVFETDFGAKYQSWESVDPAELFQAPIIRKPTKGSVVKHLQDEAKGCDFIVLWMDCDR